MPSTLDIQRISAAAEQPTDADFSRWVAATLAGIGENRAVEVAIRIVDEAEIQELNRDYRDKDKPTNVLSFPSELPDFVLAELEELPLGDLVICAGVVAVEAAEQGKPLAEHWAHMTVHGVLHLLGYDHIEAADAAEMEPLEISVLAGLGIQNPYGDE